MPRRAAPARAHAAGADLATLRPHDAARLGPVLMAAATIAAERARLLIAQGTEAMLRQRLAGTTRQDTATGLPSFDDFRRIMELELKRARRYGYALSVCQLAINAGDPPAPGAIGNELRLRVAAAIGQAIRDIDFPVEIAGDRFLVLLPYTDAAGATAVARRILIALRDGKPVRGAGRTWLPDVAIGVAGIAAGAPVSMAELMRHAGEALRQARGRGVELVVA
ncbi:MAG: diguanylate cyclase [Kofleriaceae bacterium]|nr:diguanylate cyclase [Kofleriaceae bacterium]